MERLALDEQQNAKGFWNEWSFIYAFRRTEKRNQIPVWFALAIILSLVCIEVHQFSLWNGNDCWNFNKTMCIMYPLYVPYTYTYTYMLLPNFISWRFVCGNLKLNSCITCIGITKDLSYQLVLFSFLMNQRFLN